MQTNIKRWRVWPAAALAVLICATSAGCTRKVYVPLEHTEMHRDTVVRVQWRTDSVVVHDSVATEVRGDTVILTRVRDRWRSREVRDTLWHARTDTVVQERLPAVVPTPEKRRQKNFGWLIAAGVALGAGLAWSVSRISKWVLRR